LIKRLLRWISRSRYSW